MITEKQKKLALEIVYSLIFIFIGSIAYAETYYVSPNGNATWSECSNRNQTCSIESAMLYAEAGDIVLFRGGIYSAEQKATPYHAWFEPSNSGSENSPIIFKAYPGETPVIQATFTTRVNDFAIGTGDSHYITWDGFTITATGNDVAGIMMGGNYDEGSFRHGLKLLNITAIAGTNNVINNDNADIVRMEGVGSGIISGCRFGNLHTSAWSDNNAALKSYHNANVIIENNEFFDSPNGISCKSTTNNMTIRNNFFHGNFHGFFMGVYGGQPNDNNIIHNNLFANNGDLSVFVRTDGMDGSHANNWEVYNNTFTKSGNGVNFGHCGKLIFYNNIIETASKNNITTVRDTTFDQIDHNQYGNELFSLQLGVYSESEVRYTSLASWTTSNYLQNGGNPGEGSLASAPLFINTSGTFNEIADFELSLGSPCKGAGRNGLDIGADISKVGPESATFADSGSTTTDNTTIEIATSPSNLRVVHQE